MALRKTWVTVVGWLLVLVGLVAIPLPGPGVLILLGGLVVLSQEYEWAERRVEPVKAKAIDGAKQGVSTYPRIVLSALSASAIIGVGVFWCVNPTIPEIWIFGPGLPFGGWPTGSSIIFSGVVALALLVYSIKRWRGEAVRERKATRTAKS